MKAIRRFCGRFQDDRGAVLVITIGVMTAVLLVAAYVVDEGIWFVHRQHLQTEADAAALAAAHDFQYPCTAGGAMDQTIATVVHQYDGTTVRGGGYNPQVIGEGPLAAAVPGPANPLVSAFSNTAHNLFSVINRPNFFDQSAPTDTGLSGAASSDGSPCSDAAIDVKLSETNVPSIFGFGNPTYINSQARVSIENLATSSGAEPFIEPLPAQLPSSIQVSMINESTGGAIAGPTTINENSSNPTTFTTAFQNVQFPAITGTSGGTMNLGLKVCYSGTCYESPGATQGVTYTRVWADATGGTAPPQVGNIAVLPDPATTATPCPDSSGTSNGMNFTSTSATCTVVVQASNVTVPTLGSNAKCSNFGLTLTATGGSPAPAVAFPCPVNGNQSVNNKAWVSSPVTITESSGLTNVTLGWSLTSGSKPNGTGSCSSTSPCTGTLGSQRINSAANTSADTSTSGSGSIVSVALTDPSGNEIMSVPAGTTENVGVAVTLLGFQESSNISSAPIELSFGGNNANAAIACNGNANGSPQFSQAIVSGCSDVYQSQPAPGTCPPPLAYSTPTSCAKENPGGGKLADDLSAGMNCRINGSGQVDNSGRCKPTPTSCTDQNKWTTQNPSASSISKILSQPDPRKLLLMITNSNALVNGASSVPVLSFATFYVTGWSATTSGGKKAADPCIGISPGTAANGLNYVGDTDPGANAPPGILMGHFVQYTVPPPTPGQGQGGSGTCVQGTFGDCIPELTK